MTIAVPAEGARGTAAIAPGSAIVHLEGDGPRRALCHYEGRVHGGPAGFRDKILGAAGRLAADHPTVARARLPLSELTPVAVWDQERLALVEVLDGAALAAWAGEDAGAIAGARMASGRASPSEPDFAAAMPGARPLGRYPGGTVWYQTRAGQIVACAMPGATPWTVFDWEDAAIPDQVRKAMTAHTGRGT